MPESPEAEGSAGEHQPPSRMPLKISTTVVKNPSHLMRSLAVSRRG